MRKVDLQRWVSSQREPQVNVIKLKKGNVCWKDVLKKME